MAQHTLWATNVAADALSRNNLHLYSSSRCCTPPHTPQSSRLDLARLDDLVRYLLQNALAPSTRWTYQSQSRYLSFCALFGINPLPLCQGTLMKFVAWLAAQGLTNSSMKGYLSGIWQQHLLQYGVEPGIGSIPLLHAALQGVKILQAMPARRPRLPITSSLLRLLKLAWERSARAATYDIWAVACTCFFGFLRSGEATVATLSGYDARVHLSC